MSKLTGGSSPYYELPADATELQDLIEHKDMSFAVGNIFKAAYRLGQKEGNTSLYDLEKIIWFAEREKSRLLKTEPAVEDAALEEGISDWLKQYQLTQHSYIKGQS